MKLTIIMILAFGILAAGYLLEKPASVTIPEVKQTGDYRRPVREGNCYRHFTPTGTVLACG
jgi:hypothetical protein